MEEIVAYLQELNTASILLRLTLSLLFGGVIGLERGRKRRPADLRTYMMVCMGAAMTMLLGQYEDLMMHTVWAEAAAKAGARIDVSRFGAQVINGVGFLGAGTVIVTGRQKIKGLTTAAGLWASACMGLAIGAGFYECILLGLVLMILCARVLPTVEAVLIEHARNINIYIEFESLEHIGEIIGSIKAQNVQIYQVDIDRGSSDFSQYPSVIFSLHLKDRQPRAQIMAAISKLDCIRIIDEI